MGMPTRHTLPWVDAQGNIEAIFPEMNVHKRENLGKSCFEKGSMYEDNNQTVSQTHLLRVYFAGERDGAEILEAERGELEHLERHERHDDVEAVEADLGGAHRLLLSLRLRTGF